MTTHETTTHARRIASAGFTLIELLVVIAIVFVLVGFLLVALRSARAGAERAESLNSLRQITAGYLAYATENDGRLLPGYVNAANIGTNPNQLDLRARLKTGFDLAPGDASSYVWRLAPYLDHNWLAFMNDYRNKQLISQLEDEYNNGSAGGAFGPATTAAQQLGIASVPSYGLNSIYLGGDNVHGNAARCPWNFAGATVQANPNTIAAIRMSEVKNPAKVLVFGASRDVADTSESPSGYCELRAPFADFNAGTQAAGDPQWTIDTTSGSPTEGQIVYLGSGQAGVPIARHGGDLVPISHLDGHVESETTSRLSLDMSRWSPFALSAQ